jgi:hypothetical protein
LARDEALRGELKWDGDAAASETQKIALSRLPAGDVVARDRVVSLHAAP